jgi:hypothetical protein
MFPEMTNAQIEHVANSICDFFKIGQKQMHRRFSGHKVFLLVLDIAGVYLCYAVATWLRFGNFRKEELLPAVFPSLVSGFVFQCNDLCKVDIFIDRSHLEKIRAEVALQKTRYRRA